MMRVALRLLLVGVLGGVLMCGCAGSAWAEGEGFGIESFGSSSVDQSEGFVTQAGSHPFALTTRFVLAHEVLHEEVQPTPAGAEPFPIEVEMPGDVRSSEVALPRGVVVDPDATPVRCTQAQLAVNTCPLASAAGLLSVYIKGFPYFVPGALYKMG